MRVGVVIWSVVVIVSMMIRVTRVGVIMRVAMPAVRMPMTCQEIINPRPMGVSILKTPHN